MRIPAQRSTFSHLHRCAGGRILATGDENAHLLEGDLVAHIHATGGTIEILDWTPDGRYLSTGGTKGRDEAGIGAIRAYDFRQDFAHVMAERVFRQE